MPGQFDRATVSSPILAILAAYEQRDGNNVGMTPSVLKFLISYLQKSFEMLSKLTKSTSRALLMETKAQMKAFKACL